MPAPGFTATVESLDYEVDIQINSLGLRGPELEEGTRHWLAVGDSFTMAVQVSAEETFAGLLSRATGSTFLNAGVDGYSTWQALGRYQRLIEQGVDVDGVLLVFFVGNDFQDNERFEVLSRQAAHLEAGSPIPRETLPWWQTFLMRHSVLYAHYRVWAKASALENGSDPDRGRWQQELAIFSAQGDTQLTHLSSKTAQALRALKQATRHNGDSLLVAVAPPAFVIDASRMEPTFEIVGLDPSTAQVTAPGATALQLLQSEQIAACDLTPPLLEAAATTDEALYFHYDGHWTAAGHSVVAETIQSCMEGLP